eukprot:6458927-Amphidinium_carterae.1
MQPAAGSRSGGRLGLSKERQTELWGQLLSEILARLSALCFERCTEEQQSCKFQDSLDCHLNTSLRSNSELVYPIAACATGACNCSHCQYLSSLFTTFHTWLLIAMAVLLNLGLLCDVLWEMSHGEFPSIRGAGHKSHTINNSGYMRHIHCMPQRALDRGINRAVDIIISSKGNWNSALIRFRGYVYMQACTTHPASLLLSHQAIQTIAAGAECNKAVATRGQQDLAHEYSMKFSEKTFLCFSDACSVATLGGRGKNSSSPSWPGSSEVSEPKMSTSLHPTD